MQYPHFWAQLTRLWPHYTLIKPLRVKRFVIRARLPETPSSTWELPSIGLAPGSLATEAEVKSQA